MIRFWLKTVAAAGAAVALLDAASAIAQEAPEDIAQGGQQDAGQVQAEAAVYDAYGRYQAALESGDAQAVLAAAEETYLAARRTWTEGAELAAIVLNYAKALREAGRTEDALAAYAECEPLFEALGGENLVHAGTCAVRSGDAHFAAGNSVEARSAYVRAIIYVEPIAQSNQNAAFIAGTSFLEAAKTVISELSARPTPALSIARFVDVDSFALIAQLYLEKSSADEQHVIDALLIRAESNAALFRMQEARELFNTALELQRALTGAESRRAIEIENLAQRSVQTRGGASLDNDDKNPEITPTLPAPGEFSQELYRLRGLHNELAADWATAYEMYATEYEIRLSNGEKPKRGAATVAEGESAIIVTLSRIGHAIMRITQPNQFKRIDRRNGHAHCIAQDTASGLVGTCQVYREEPRYPLRALQGNISGRIIVSFDISEKGRTRNIRIEQSSDAIFDEPSIRAIDSWRYMRPMSLKGETGTLEGVATRFDFAIAQ